MLYAKKGLEKNLTFIISIGVGDCDGRRGKNDFPTRGNHGKFIYVSPSKELIIVRNGGRYGIPAENWVGLSYKFATLWNWV
jgi:hypothetical protein